MRKLQLWECLVGLGILFVLAAILWPVTACACGGGSAERAACLSNIKQQGLGAIMYAGDWNDRLPHRDRWATLLEPYTKNEAIFEDRVDKEPLAGGYSYNGTLSQRKLDEFAQPVKTPLTYDSINMARNASDLVTSLPEPGRHKGRNNMSYLDGHARAIPVPAKP